MVFSIPSEWLGLCLSMVAKNAKRVMVILWFHPATLSVCVSVFHRDVGGSRHICITSWANPLKGWWFHFEMNIHLKPEPISIRTLLSSCIDSEFSRANDRRWNLTLISNTKILQYRVSVYKQQSWNPTDFI